MRFEEKKFVQVSTLADRWDCGRTMIYDLISKNQLRVWHPDGTPGRKGIRIEVQSILAIEKRGIIRSDEGT